MADRIPCPVPDERIAAVLVELLDLLDIPDVMRTERRLAPMREVVRGALHEAAAAEAEAIGNTGSGWLSYVIRDRARAHRAAAEEPTR